MLSADAELICELIKLMLDDVTEVAMYTFRLPFAMMVELLTLIPTEETTPVPPHESSALP
jgi:hypothetical protein